MKATFVFAFVLALTLAEAAFATDWIARTTQRRIRIATQVVSDRMLSNRPVPSYVLDQTNCIASLKVVKVGFIWGGEGSTGLVSCRIPGRGWSAPSFLNVGGVNFGIQFGVQFIQSVVTFMTDPAQNALNQASFKVGTDVSFAAGPVGEGGGAGLIPHAALLTYDKTVGLYAGATINGFIITHGLRRNQEVYGPGASPAQILSLPGEHAPVAVQPFVEVLERFAPGRL